MLYLFILGRILFGGYFIKNGLNHFQNLNGLTGYAASKGVPMPKYAVMLTGLMFLVGGLGMLLGVSVQCSAILLAVALTGITFYMHRFWEVSDPMARMVEEINFYKNLGLVGASLMMLAIPTPWYFALALF